MLDAVITYEHSHAWIRLSGELAIESVDSFSAALAPLHGKCRTANVDLSGLVFMDSSGVGALLSLCNDLQAVGGSLIVSEIPPLIQEVLDTLGLLEILGGSKAVDARGT